MKAEFTTLAAIFDAEEGYAFSIGPITHSICESGLLLQSWISRTIGCSAEILVESVIEKVSNSKI